MNYSTKTDTTHTHTPTKYPNNYLDRNDAVNMHTKKKKKSSNTNGEYKSASTATEANTQNKKNKNVAIENFIRSLSHAQYTISAQYIL